MKVRAYRMGRRAESAAATRERILDATEALFWERPEREATLKEIADRAGVSVQTVIRRFGGREGVETAAQERGYSRIAAERDEAEPGDVPGAVRILVGHYEDVGDGVLRMLAGEHRRAALAAIAARGRAMHVAWCERVFAAALARRGGTSRSRLLAQLAAVCDVYTWKLLRHDSGLSRAQTELALGELITCLVKET